MVGKKLSVLLSALLCALTVVGCGKEAAVSYESFLSPAAAPLTEEQLADCTEWFARIENNGLLRVPYTDAAGAPEQLVPYLEILLYDVGETDLTGEELALIENAGAYMDLVGKYRLSRTLIAGYLEEKLGIRPEDSARILEAPDPSPAGIYLDEYDAWYIVHGDTWFEEYSFIHGEKHADGSVRLFYTNPFLTVAKADGSAEFLRDQLMAVTLVCKNGAWYVASNEILQ